MRNWEDRVKADSTVLVNSEGLIANEAPSDDDPEKCRELGRSLAE
ncbi:MAG: hypothetical protein ACI4JK_01590 [Oscillospiraceae bacterium]